MPILTLPLRIHLIRSDELGCSPDLNVSSIPLIVDEMNTYWKQAGIRFRLMCERTTQTPDDRPFDTPTDTADAETNNANGNHGHYGDGIIEHDIDKIIPRESRQRARRLIRHGLIRGPDGKIQNKDQRQRVFTGELLQPLGYRDVYLKSFDIYFFDMVGMGSQGVCICRSSRTVIMGERSTVSAICLVNARKYCNCDTFSSIDIFRGVVVNTCSCGYFRKVAHFYDFW